MRQRILKIAFLIWIVLWLFFIARELFVKGGICDYKILLSRSLDGKRSYVTGDRFYGFLKFCNKNIPMGSTYDLIGLKEGSIEGRMAAYYLYPNVRDHDPEFLLVYDTREETGKGYDMFMALDESEYILKKHKRHNIGTD